MAALLDLIAPPRCAACGVRGRLPWCDTCHREAAALRRTQGCRRCAGACQRDDPTCPLAPVGVGTTVAAFTYTGVVARTVVAAKLGGAHAAWQPLGAHLGALACRVGPDVDLVVPVATESGRARRRGFDHTALLGREVGRALDVPCVRALRTRRWSPDRGREGADGDLPAGSTWAVRTLTGRRVMLVDDVLTTGATVRAAARALQQSGAAEVHVAVLARAGH